MDLLGVDYNLNQISILSKILLLTQNLWGCNLRCNSNHIHKILLNNSDTTQRIKILIAGIIWNWLKQGINWGACAFLSRKLLGPLALWTESWWHHLRWKILWFLLWGWGLMFGALWLRFDWELFIVLWLLGWCLLLFILILLQRFCPVACLVGLLVVSVILPPWLTLVVLLLLIRFV